MPTARSAIPSASSHNTMRVVRRGTSRANRSSSRLKGTERANSRWFCEKTSSSRTSMSASSRPSASIALRARASTLSGIVVNRVRSCRLLRRHLMDLARREIEPHALDVVEIGAGHPDEAGAVGVVDRVDGAVLVDAGMSGQQAILLHRLEFGLPGIAAVVLALPF